MSLLDVFFHRGGYENLFWWKILFSKVNMFKDTYLNEVIYTDLFR